MFEIRLKTSKISPTAKTHYLVTKKFLVSVKQESNVLTLWARMEVPSEQANVTSTKLSSCSS